MTTSKLYYEAHVTIEPVFDERLIEFTKVCKQFKFHVAKLLMQKRSKDGPERSKYDSFCTTRSQDYDEIQQRTLSLVDELERSGFQVWRYKIEDTLLDSRIDDSLRPLTQ